MLTGTRQSAGQEETLPDRRSVNELLDAARARLDRLAPTAAQQAAERGAIVVDTRCAEQRRETGVIPGSVHVPLSVLYWRLDPASGFEDSRLADPERQVILVCAHGYSSSLAAATLQDLGFAQATDIAGGFEAWQAAGLPIEAAPD
jgi:rhodanese-related sulfurtransferase